MDPDRQLGSSGTSNHHHKLSYLLVGVQPKRRPSRLFPPRVYYPLLTVVIAEKTACVEQCYVPWTRRPGMSQEGSPLAKPGRLRIPMQLAIANHACFVIAARP